MSNYSLVCQQMRGRLQQEVDEVRELGLPGPFSIAFDGEVISLSHPVTMREAEDFVRRFVRMPVVEYEQPERTGRA